MNAFVVINVLCVLNAGFVYSKPSVSVSSVQQESSTSVSESSYSASSSSSSSCTSSSGIDTALYQKAFGLASICDAESALYLQYLSQLPSAQLSAFDQLIDYYSSTSFALADSVNDFVAFQNAMSNIYQTFQAQSLYAANADWMTQTALYEQAKANFATALGCCAPNSALYNLVNYASTDLTYMPLIAGTCYHLANLQNQYYSASGATSSSVSSSTTSTSGTSSVSTSTSSTCSNIDTSLFQKAFGLASINEAESALYLQYLSNVPSAQISYFNDLVNLYSSQSFAMADLVTDFAAFQNSMSSIYQTFQAQSLYAANADWATQTALYEQAKANFATALGCCAPNSALYNLLNFASTDLTYMPLVAGTCYHLANLQNQYYSASGATSVSSTRSTTSGTSSVSTSTSSTCSNIDTSLFQNAFSLASINEAESALYLQYLSQVPSAQISYFNDLVNLYSSDSFAMADLVTDFAAFQSSMSSIYQTFQAQSLYAANADWLTQTAIYEQAKANFATALGCCAPNSALYNLLNFASTDLTYMPLVAGTCYHLANLQNQYYAATSGASSIQQSSSYESSSYQASSSSSSSMTSSSSGGSALLVA